eukprot:jgi/Tetstr1/440428/TSEL_028761.t1
MEAEGEESLGDPEWPQAGQAAAYLPPPAGGPADPPPCTTHQHVPHDAPADPTTADPHTLLPGDAMEAKEDEIPAATMVLNDIANPQHDITTSVERHNASTTILHNIKKQ